MLFVFVILAVILFWVNLLTFLLFNFDFFKLLLVPLIQFNQNCVAFIFANYFSLKTVNYM